MTLVLVGLTAGATVPARSAAAQDEGPRPFCVAGRPADECKAFLVATLNYFPGRDRSEAEPWRFAEWEIGWMENRGPRDAVGGAIAVGVSELGFHLAAKARLRRWLARGAALDVGAGVILAQHPPDTYPHRTIGGLTADVSLGLTDVAAVTARAQLIDSATRAEVGVRFGTVPGILATVVGLAGMLGAALNAS